MNRAKTNWQKIIKRMVANARWKQKREARCSVKLKMEAVR